MASAELRGSQASSTMRCQVAGRVRGRGRLVTSPKCARAEANNIHFLGRKYRSPKEASPLPWSHLESCGSCTMSHVQFHFCMFLEKQYFYIRLILLLP